jgi:general secretion pathway protein G
MRRPIKLRSLSSFTLIELLVVMVIIAILAALTLAAYTGVFKTAARARARSEITAISAALESYKTDNGVYPTPSAAVGFTSTN